MTVVEGPRTYAEAIAWIKAHPTKHQGGPWAGVPAGRSWCEQLMNNAGGFGADAYESAALAGNASGGLDPRQETAKQGDFVYWTNHVGLVTRPGFMICASTLFSGSGVGEISFAAYGARFASSQHWRGHSPNHGHHTLKKVVPAVPAKPVVTATPTVVKPPPINPIPPLPLNLGQTLPQNHVILPNHYLSAGEYRLQLGPNSILVELGVGGHLIWHTSSAAAAKVINHGKTYAVLQPDGNFVLYGFYAGGKRVALWSSGTTGAKYRAAGERVILQPDGHLYVQPASGIGKTIVKAR